ncbi:MAG: DUF1189 family protein [Legionella sp.]
MSKITKELKLDSQAIYTWKQALYLSFYSSRLYIDVYKRWCGYGIVYLCLVLAITAMPISARLIINLGDYFNQEIMLPLQSLPIIDIQNGMISFDKPMPYKIKNAQGDVIAIIDTTGAINKITKDYPKLVILVNQNRVTFRTSMPKLFLKVASYSQPQDDFFVYKIDKNSNQVFGGEHWLESTGIYQLKIATQLAIYPIIVMFFFAIFWVFLLTLALLGQLLGQMFFSTHLTYKQSCRLLAVAATPAFAFFFYALTTNLMLDGLGLLGLALLAGYFFYGVISIKHTTKHLVVG